MIKKTITRVAGLSLKAKIILSVVVLVVLGLIGFWISKSHSSSAATATRSKRGLAEQVSIASVSSLTPNSAALSVIGQVSSENQATILSQVAGEIVHVNRQLGDSVSAGDVIATMDDSSQQAAVDQAQGSYDAALAALAQASGTTANNSTITSNQAALNVQNAQLSVEASLKSLYTAMDDAVTTKSDTLFRYHNSQLAGLNQILQYPNDTDLQQTVENERPLLDPMLANDDRLAYSATSSDVDADVSSVLGDAETIESFLDNLSQIVDSATPDSTTASTIATFETTIASARSEVTTAVTNLNTAKSTYDAAAASASTAANTATTGTNGSIAVAQANVEESLGALNAAKASLEKTIVRSPISGTIISLPVTDGDYVQSFTEVAEVSNPSALKLVTNVTASDAATLNVGNKATINGSIAGVITQVAPAINPTTGTIEVDVGITGDQGGLVDGDSVTVDLTRTSSSLFASKSTATSTSQQIIIPIVALKITPTGPIVFTVSTSTSPTLVPHPVQIGSILGQNIVITSGLTPQMVIVTDARGLTDGENVTIKKS